MKERRKMSLMKNNTNKILAFLMALLMIIQLMPFTSLAEDDPDGVETSEILETITEDDFENEIEDEPEEEDPEEDEGLPDETEEDEDLEDDGAEADDSETDETDGEDDIPASFEIEDLSDPEVWEALFDNPDVEIIMDAEIPEAEDPVPVEEYTMEDMIQDNYDGSWIKYGIYNNKHTYVLTEEPTGVFSDPALTDESLVYTISEDNAILLATEHYEMWNTTGVPGDGNHHQPGQQHTDAVEGIGPHVIHAHALRDKRRAPDYRPQEKQQAAPQCFTVHGLPVLYFPMIL